MTHHKATPLDHSLPCLSTAASGYHRGMPVLRRGTLLVVGLWLWAGVFSAQSTRWRGTWTATVGGQPVTGTWTASLGENPNVALGGWTLLDGSGKPIASGTWSARKADKGWQGAWQARVSSGQTHSGTWTARSPIVSPARLVDLLDFALTNITSGTWQTTRKQSGAWSIRAYAEE